jgi:hypothetical protein
MGGRGMRVCRRGAVAHVSRQTGADCKACPGRHCVEAGVDTRNWVAIQMPSCHRCGSESGSVG